MNSENHIPRAAIVLLCYNNKDLVQNYLPKIIATTPDHPDYKIVVVDNAGSDGTDEWVKQNHPNVQVIKLEVNKGFTNGYVESLQYVEAHNYVLISADVEVAEDWLLPCLDRLESDPNIAVVQPKIMSWDRRDTFEYAGGAGGFIDFLGYPFCRGRMVNELEQDHSQYDDSIDIFWASGACFFIKSEAWKATGGFDNQFFAHMEEIDLCWRLKQRGRRIVFEPSSKVYHMGGAVIKYGSPAKVYQNHRNNLAMLLKNLPLSYLLWLVPIRIVLDYVAALSMVAEGNFRTALAVPRAHWHLLTKKGLWRNKRKDIRKHRKVGFPIQGTYKGSLIVAFFLSGKKKFSSLKGGKFI